ncbi:MAG: ferrous iron transport protein B [Bdellovibrionales bacterium]|nr:ferrous iron transport protein B [Bdellovibrionales bacterium]
MTESVRLPLIALAGNPNSGKTALFNALTGSRQKVANYPGVTVERREGRLSTSSGKGLRVLDLPGVYSLDPQSPDEEVTRDVLLKRLPSEDAPEALVVVVDATALERSLALVLELKPVFPRMVVALNMADLAKARGQELDLQALSKGLGVPVVCTVATRGQGIIELLAEVERALEASPRAAAVAAAEPDHSVAAISARFAEVDRILKASRRHELAPSFWTERLDRVVVHPLWGSLLLGVVLAAVFEAVFTWAGPLQDLVDALFAWLGESATAWLPAGPLQSLIVDGIIAGVGGVVIFLPQIVLLFLFILLMEDSGYMARAAFLMDRIMGRVGLHGRAFIPLLSSFACAIPGIMATRTIENRRERMATMMVAPLMTCSARLPVYALLIAAFIPNRKVLGPFGLQGLTMFGLYALGVVSAMAVAWTLRLTALKGPQPHLLLELPTYKLPAWRNVLMGLAQRSWMFVRRAGTIILSLSIVIWFLASYPKSPEGAPGPAIQYSYAGRIGHAVEPVFRPIGFDWRISTGLIPGFAAREVMVGALATVYAVEAEDEEKLQTALGDRLAGSWSLATALALLIWYVFAPQCLSTLAVARRETNSWAWTGFMLFYLTALAYVGAFIAYQGAVLLGWG